MKKNMKNSIERPDVIDNQSLNQIEDDLQVMNVITLVFSQPLSLLRSLCPLAPALSFSLVSPAAATGSERGLNRLFPSSCVHADAEVLLRLFCLSSPAFQSHTHTHSLQALVLVSPLLMSSSSYHSSLSSSFAAAVAGNKMQA